MSNKLPIIDKKMIRDKATAVIYARGKEYVDSVYDLTIRGHLLTATVQGSEYHPYDVYVMLTETGIGQGDCSCPYDSFCKHLVAVLLAYIEQRDQLIAQPTVEELIETLDHDRRGKLLIYLAEENATLAEDIEQWVMKDRMVPDSPIVATLEATPTAPKSTTKLIDTTPLAHSLRVLLRNHNYEYDDYHDESEGFEDVVELIKIADPYIQAGDGENAWRVLATICDLVFPEILDKDQDSSSDLVVSELAEPLLLAGLLSDEIRPKLAQAQRWADHLEEHHKIDHNWSATMLGLEQGWNSPKLQAALRGEEMEYYDSLELPSIDDNGIYGDLAGDVSVALAQGRLKVLEIRQQYDAYLNLAKATEQDYHYALCLGKLGRVEEAVAVANSLDNAEELLQVAKAVQPHSTSAALQIAERGFLSTQRAEVAEVARWAYDIAMSEGDNSFAQRCGYVAFYASWQLEDYKRLKATFSADEWSKIKESVWSRVEAECQFGGYQVVIFLAENEIARAIATVKKKGYSSYNFSSDYSNLFERTIIAAIPVDPQWVIEETKKRAEAVMDGARSKSYDEAAHCLSYTRDAYLEQGKRAEWKAYQQGLFIKHSRKRNLIPLLQAL